MRFLTAAAAVAALIAPLPASAQTQRTNQRPPARRGAQQKNQPEPKQPTSQPRGDAIPSSDDPVRLGTELVNVLFSVADSNNRPISNVRQQDVVVLEDGRQQDVFTFKREANLPMNIALLIDLSGSQEYTFPQEKMAAAYFLHSVIRPGTDSAAILTFQDDVDLVQGLTSRIETLNRALDDIQYARRFGTLSSRNQATALYDSVYITVDEVLGRDEDRGAGLRPVRASEGIDYSVKRRAIILLTDGVDNASNRKIEEAVDRAWRSGVMIFAIGIGDRFRFEGVREDVLARLSEETGGRAYFPRGPDDLMAHFRQIENELRSQYLVAYAPSNTRRDGSFRRIEIRLAGRQDARVIHRRGYYAPLEDSKK